MSLIVMAGAIAIVVVLLLFPVAGADAERDHRRRARPAALERDAEIRNEGSELLDSERLSASPPMHRTTPRPRCSPRRSCATRVDRVRLDPPPLDGPRTPAELRAMAGKTITADGIGGLEALRVFGDVLAPACISVDHPRFLSFVPAAPTEASILFDLVVGASSIYAGSWLEGGGAVFAENEALRWIADLAGLPADGRRRVRQRRHGRQPERARRRPLAVAPTTPAARHDRTRGLIVTSTRRPLVGRARRPG